MSDKKQQIIAAATRSFERFGYKATTMEHVARGAKVSKGSIYMFFATKEELFQQIVSQTISEMVTTAKAAMAHERTFLARLNRALISALKFRHNQAMLFQLAQEARAMQTAAVAEAMRLVEEEVLSFVEELLEEGMHSGEIPPCNTKLYAFIIVELYIALLFKWEEHHDSLNDETIATLFRHHFKGGVNDEWYSSLA